MADGTSRVRAVFPLRIRARWIAWILLPVLLYGCGGGGGAAPPVLTILARLISVLSGQEEVAVVDAGARGAATLQLRSDGQLVFSVTGEPRWTATVTGLHIHRGAAGANGPIVVDLLSGGATFAAGTATASDTITIDPALAAEIAAAPEGFYLNVHTVAAPAGLARGQAAPFAPLEWHAKLLGSKELVVADATARGGVAITATSPTSVDFVIAMGTPSVTALSMAHIHVGGPTVNGGILVDLGGAPGALLDPALGTLSGTAAISAETLARILANAGGFYVNVHTAAAPAGVARGQLAAGPMEFNAALRGDEEVPVAVASATGGATLRFDSFTTGHMILAVHPDIGIGAMTMAHLHSGAAGVNGPVVIDLLVGADLILNGPTASAEGSIGLTPSLFARVCANPAAFYVNVHSAGAPGGLARGQLSDRPRNFFAALDGDNETVVVDPAAAGTLSLVVEGAARCSFTLVMTNPAPGVLTAGHVHDGIAGVNGPALIDLLGGTGITISGSLLTGNATFTGRTFARLMAAADRFYGNVHSAAAPAGLARGQLMMRLDTVPPNGLTYASPVVYSTGVPISPNVPTSTGGNVAVYSVAPPLPAGFTFDPDTGTIAGTPTTATAQADYTVTASNGAGADTFDVRITVLLSPPASLAYATPVTYVVGSPIPANSPSSTGGAISSYSAPGGVPGGLFVNAITGVLTGTPTTASAATNYTIRGTNASGFVDAIVNIRVNASLTAPSGLSYTTPVSYATGTAITPNKPTVGGGPVSTWSVSPALPAGLMLDTTNGDIKGTPTAVTTATNYTVTASNAAGSANAVVNIATPLGAPNCTSYSPGSLIEYTGQASGGASIVCSGGGAATSYSIDIALPTGMTFDTTTGAIGGTPTVTSSFKTYTITASNSAGSSQASISIVVY
ncbi:MAG: CHRD domain-containing protein [Planctomycetaceae bacterium]